MNYHLIVQPLDCDYSFLEDIGRKSVGLYEFRIGSFEVLQRRTLPDRLVMRPRSFLAKLLMRGRRMIYLDELTEELKNHWIYNPRKLMLFVLPHFVIGFGHDLAGLSLESNMSIISTYGISERNLPQACVGLGLHEIGHNLGLRHCKTKNCLMRAPCKPKNFYEKIPWLCSEHRNEFSNICTNSNMQVHN